MGAAAWTIGHFIVETLAANGIDTVFGIPGVHNIELYRGLEGARLRHVLARHEQNAGFASDGYARASGRCAAAFVISGPGVTNVLTAVAQAYSDSVPLLVIASSPARPSLGQGWGVLHELRDQRSLAAQAFGFAGSAREACELPGQLRAAFASLRAARPRPAYVEVPLDLLGTETTLRAERYPAPPSPPAPPGPAVALAREWLRVAERPALIIGGGARSAGAAARTLVEALDGYLVSTVAAKGSVAESHPANLGTSLPYRPTQELLADADVVIAAGTELSESDLYTTTRLPLRGRLIRIDVDPGKLNDHYAAALPIEADAAATLTALAAELPRRTGWRTHYGDAAAHRARIDAGFDAETHGRLRALRAVRAALPADAVIFSDMTQIAYLGNYAFPAERPGLWHHPSGYGTLGYALPAALGAKVAQPERPVLALAGDFGAQFTLAELMTAVELDVSLPVIVWNNEALGQIRDDMEAAGIAPIGVQGRNPDFVALAAAYGAAAARVHSPQELTRSVRDALGRAGPTLVEAVAADFRRS